MVVFAAEFPILFMLLDKVGQFYERIGAGRTSCHEYQTQGYGLSPSRISTWMTLYSLERVIISRNRVDQSCEIDQTSTVTKPVLLIDLEEDMMAKADDVLAGTSQSESSSPLVQGPSSYLVQSY